MINTLRPNIKVMVVDDHSFIRDSLTALINHESDLEICGAKCDIFSTLQAVQKLMPDIMVIDLCLGQEDGTQLISQIHSNYPKIGIIGFSVLSDSHYIRRCFEAGANGYVPKEYSATRLIEAIRKVASGGTYFGSWRMNQNKENPPRLKNSKMNLKSKTNYSGST